MLKDVRSYLRQCWSYAIRHSWNIASGFTGVVLAGLLLIWPGIIEILSDATPQTTALNGLVSFVLYTIAVWSFILLMRFLFVSPFQLHHKLRSENERLSADLDSLIEGGPNLPMSDAIAHIRESKEAWKNASPEIIQKAITDLALGEKISVWGQPGEFLNFQKDFEDSIRGSPEAPIRVPFYFFYDVAGGLYEDRGFMLRRSREYPESDKVTSYKRIFNVTVNRGQIDAIFSRKKP
jgi:hypothetical protein